MRERGDLIVRRGSGVGVAVLREREGITILGMRDGEVVPIGEGEIEKGMKGMMIGIGVDVEEGMIIISGDRLFSFLFEKSWLAIVNTFKSGTEDS
jgi:hypothetical protein